MNPAAPTFLATMFRALLALLLAGVVSAQPGPAPLSPQQTPVLSPEATPEATPEPTPEPIQHNLDVYLDPFNAYLEVTDLLSFPDATNRAARSFTLNTRLRITASSIPVSPAGSADPGYVPSTANQGAELTTYRFTPPRRWNGELQLSYAGTINDLIAQSGAEYAQSFSETSGIIAEDGVFLSRASGWVPEFADRLVSFSLTTRFADTAADWSAVSQGAAQDNQPGPASARGEAPTTWVASTPQEEIYLIAADFTLYQQSAGDTQAMAYLRTPDSNLASQYLDATNRYLALYEPLLGDYAYTKFALVENFWETGYGMPSFTLLGPRVIRFPFILETSYPHEILHNWWGNGVYPDYQSGNWSEGLTAYLADHLFREMDGRGSQYRKDMLSRYKNYVADDADFPLSEFTSRNSAATQAVGYGKTLMVWHMLRIELGDELFLEGLRRFYRDYLHRRAGWNDIETLFSDVSGADLEPFFQQWVQRTGAPELSISVDSVNGNRARLMFAQVHAGDPYQLTVPVALFYEGEEQPRIYNIALSQKLEGVMADDYDRLQAILVDPYFDVFRTLDREETPPTIGELFGASELAFVVPDANRDDWMRLAEAFSEGIDAEILLASEIDSLPADRSLWVLGRDNPFAATVLESAAAYGAARSASGFNMAGEQVEFDDRSSVIIARHPADPELAAGLIHIEDMVAIPGMIEKLPHYGRYSYLSFYGDEPTNDVSGIWASPDSPMQWVNPDFAPDFSPDTTGNIDWRNLPPVEPLAILPPEYLPDDLLSHVRELSSQAMQGRGLGSRGIERAAAYLAEQFASAGLRPLNGTYRQRWQATVPGQGQVTMDNIIGVIPGSNPEFSAEPVIVGAHYDHLGIDAQSGRHFPGADDNASGIAVLLEVAGKLSQAFTPQRPIVFVAFTGEENGLLGSQYFIDNPPAGYDSSDFFAMINLDAVGRLAGRPLQVFATDSAYEWPYMAQGIGFTIGVDATFPSETIASSDHVSFLNAGVPAIHLFSGTHNDYHRISDSADKLDTAGMSDVALWLEEAVVYLADRTDPLRSNLAGAEPVASSGQTTAREAALGTVPDFAYSGEGVRISDVTPNSAAQAAGLQAGDVLLRFNGESVTDLQRYSNLLREAAPGDRVTLEILRDGSRSTVETELTAR